MIQAEINGTMLNYHVDGPEYGETVMLSNSLASDLGMWKYQEPDLIDAGYRVLRYDNRGHGQSAASPGPYSLELLAGDALALMDHLELEKVHFCGLSLGGMVGQMLGAFHGDRLISLALCATGSYLSLPDSEWEERVGAARANGMEALADGTIERWFTEAGRKRLAEDVAEVRKSIVNTSVEGYSGCVAALRAMDLREAIRGISIPTLIMVGAEDQGTPVSASEFMHKRIPASLLKVIPDAAHFVNMEQSEVFNAALIQFLGENKT
jgi:3-oxoadipate enol-lactonase